MRFVSRVVAWLLIAGVVVATLGPPRLRPVTDLGQNVEHGLAFIMLGLAFGLGYPGRFWLLAIASVPLIGVLEVLQTWMPGRHARFGDFVVDALAALVGLAAAAVLARAVGRPPQRN